jgi:hypothetical protein
MRKDNASKGARSATSWWKHLGRDDKRRVNKSVRKTGKRIIREDSIKPDA